MPSSDSVPPGLAQMMQQMVSQGQQGAQNPLSASPDQLTQFQARMGTPPVAPTDMMSTEPNKKTQTAFSTAMLSNWGAVRDPSLQGLKQIRLGSPTTIGDAILQQIGKESTQYKEELEGIHSAILNIPKDVASNNLANFYALQWKLTAFSVHQQVASKIASKIEQGIQTLFTNQ